MDSGFSRFAAVRDEDKEEFFKLLKADFKIFYEEYSQDSSFSRDGCERSNFILQTLLKTDSYKEFYWYVKYFDSEKKRLKLKEKGFNIRNNINELTALNNTILSTKGWKYTKPLRSIKKVFR